MAHPHTQIYIFLETLEPEYANYKNVLIIISHSFTKTRTNWRNNLRKLKYMTESIKIH